MRSVKRVENCSTFTGKKRKNLKNDLKLNYLLQPLTAESSATRIYILNTTLVCLQNWLLSNVTLSIIIVIMELEWHCCREEHGVCPHTETRRSTRGRRG